MKNDWIIWKINDTRKIALYFITDSIGKVIYVVQPNFYLTSLRKYVFNENIHNSSIKFLKIKDIPEHSIKMLLNIKPNATIEDLLKI